MLEDFNFELKDKFLDRLMIPINDLDGNVVGFTGRIITENPNRPKYLNSPDSNWFKKGNLWFGLNSAKKSIIKHKKVLIVEGNMDVLACHELGFPFAIASQGTSFTSFQIQILTRITKTIWLAFDNDNSGKIAAEKFFVESSRFGLQIWQVIIPDKYKDLDEFLHSDFDLQTKKNEENFRENSLENSEENTNLSQKLELTNLQSQKNLEKKMENEFQNRFQNEQDSNENIENIEKSINKTINKNSQKNLQVLPFLDYKLEQISQNWNLENSYEQNDQINRFLELTIWIKRLEIEQILTKLANQTQFSKKILEEMRNEIVAKNSKFANQNQPNFEQKLEIDKISQKILQKPKKTQNREINLAWQNLVSFYVAKKLDLNLVSKMESIFILLKNFISNLEEFENFEDYLEQKKDELLLIYENIKHEELFVFRSNKIIQDFLDKQFFGPLRNPQNSQIFQDENILKHYKIYKRN